VESDAVDGENVVLEIEIVFKDVADQPGEVVVDDQVDRQAVIFRGAFSQPGYAEKRY